jgi:hypothetical protein
LTEPRASGAPAAAGFPGQLAFKALGQSAWPHAKLKVRLAAGIVGLVAGFAFLWAPSVWWLAAALVGALLAVLVEASAKLPFGVRYYGVWTTVWVAAAGVTAFTMKLLLDTLVA